MIAYPLLKWSQRRYAGKPCTFKDDYILIPILMCLFVVWGVITTYAIPSEIRWTYNLPSDIILFCALMLFFFVPHNLIKNREDGYKYSLLLRFLGPAATILLCPFKQGDATN